MSEQEEVEEKEAVVEEETVEEEAVKEKNIDQIQFFKHETITDAKNIIIDIMVPVSISKSGKISVDKSKPKVFMGKTPVNVGDRVVPFPFAIENAKNTYEAINTFEKCANKALNEVNKRREEEMRKMNEEKIIVPNESGKIIV